MKKTSIAILSLVMSVLLLVVGCSGGKTSETKESGAPKKPKVMKARMKLK